MTTNPMRTPYCHKIRYGITGTPILTEDEMDGTHAPGVGVRPTLIEFVYSVARDGKSASVSAAVTGTWTRFGEPADGQVTAHFVGAPSGWPEWLAEEARLHDPDVASSAVSVVPPATNQTALREQIAGALVSWTYRGKDPDPGIGMLETVRANAYSRADAVLAVLPAPVDRAAVLRDFLWRLEQSAGDAAAEKLLDDNPELRRLAAEAPHAETPDDAAALLALVRDFLDPDPCSFDHHGYCQAHAAGFGGEPLSCPHGRARKLLEAVDEPAVVAQPGKETDEVRPCDGCGHPEHPAHECPVTLYGERCACDEPTAAGVRQDGAQQQ